MKYIEKLMKLQIFTVSDVVRIVGDYNLAKTTIANYLKRGYIKRIKHNLYTPVSFETDECVANKFVIGSNITSNSFISHHSAFEFYNYYNQVYNTVNISSISKFKDFEFEGNKYIFISVQSNEFIQNIRGVNVTSIERTIVDCIKDLGKHCELEETLESIKQIPYINFDDILNYLKLINSKTLYKKVGLLLSTLKDELNVPSSFFDECHRMSDSVVGYFGDSKNCIYNSEWKLYIQKGLI